MIPCFCCLAILLIAAVAVPQDDVPGGPRLRVLTYNIHHGEGTDGKFDYDRLARVITGLKPDVVALQEVDRKTGRAGGADQVAILEEKTGMHAVFGNALHHDGGEYGEALLSRFPMEKVKAHSLPFRSGQEPRTALEAVVRPDNGLPDFVLVGTHLCHQSPETRVEQAEQIQRLFPAAGGPPIILGGDLNARTGSKAMDIFLAERWIDATTPASNIDYVLIRRGDPWRVVDVNLVEETVVSDHRPLLVVLEWQGQAPGTAPDALDELYSLAPTSERPVARPAPEELRTLRSQLEKAFAGPAAAVRAHPASETFPGVVPGGAERISRTVELKVKVGAWRARGPYSNSERPTWHSTGLYAAPGETVEVIVAESDRVPGLRLRVGCHRDRLWRKETWKRLPEISHSWPLTGERTRVASPFGGLIYVEVPVDCQTARIRAEVKNAVEAPWFVLGTTTASDWRERLRTRPAPWGELATEKLVISLPSSVLRDLDDPTAVLTFWNRVLDSCADLAAWPRDRYRPERFVADVQISAGYMHAGYPLMTHLDVTRLITDREALLANEHQGTWGLFHEIGHNHQSADWTFSGTTEVTVNLFTLHVYHTVHGIREPRSELHGASREAKLTKYREGGASFEAWKRDPFLALLMYMQIQEAFGWEPYRKVFAEYRGLSSEDRPRRDEEKRDQWLVRLSRAVGRNLGPFFEAWGVPVSAQAREAVDGLPPWIPESLAGQRRERRF